MITPSELLCECRVRIKNGLSVKLKNTDHSTGEKKIQVPGPIIMGGLKVIVIVIDSNLNSFFVFIPKANI